MSAAGAAASSSSSSSAAVPSWDPDSAPPPAVVPKSTLSRIRSDLRAVFADPLPGIMVVPDPASLLRCSVLITGPQGTPYADGLFLFALAFPADYPTSPPKVKLLTTGGGVTRFNPNLYRSGKVCLSILGTWAGPGWTPVQTLASVLLSIQSLMSEYPYTNEPGFERAPNSTVLRDYNDIVVHETLRIGVLDTAGHPERLPEEMVAPVREALLAVAEGGAWAERCDALAPRLDGTPFADPYHENVGVFRFGDLKRALAELAAREAAVDAAARAAEAGAEEDEGEGAGVG
jgi:ubiquitin-conjugating enzyme E2 Z